jgi:four helix bundle protein
MTINSYKDLIVWQKSLILVKEVYKITELLPKNEVFGLISQMRRSAVSIPSNIAEGRQRSSRKDFVQFLRIAQGSCAELETQLLITKDIYPEIKQGKIEESVTEIQKMLSSMIGKLLEKKANSS